MNEKHEAKKAAIQEINRLAKQNDGKITPLQLVEAAQDTDSPLHGYFEWDDTEAAQKYREAQARTLLRSCEIKFTVNNRKISVPSYVRDPEADSMAQGYVQTTTIKTDEDAAREVLIKEFKRIGSLLKRARQLGVYFDMDHDLEQMESSLDMLQSRIDPNQPTV